MKLQFLGGARTVTGSKTLLTFHGERYLVDCGLFQGPKEMRLKNWEPFPEANKIRGVFLTHAHLDHSGYIPKLIKEGMPGKIFCSEGTFDLCRILLVDSGKLQEEDARFANKTGYSHHKPALPLYTEKDARTSLSKFVPLARDQWHSIVRDLDLRFLRSGHIIGSSFVQLHCDQNGQGRKVITFSGDLGHGHSPTLKPPVVVDETDYLVLESTYGNRLHPHGDTLEQLKGVINKVMERKGVLVIPAFSVGRTQDVLYYIRELELQNKIPSVPVYLDSPMATEATQVYMNHPEDQSLISTQDGFDSPISTKNYHTVASSDESMLLCMQDGPFIVVSAAGMLTGGRVMHHLAARLGHERNGVLFVGYQAEGTKGRLLQDGIASLRIHHKEIDVEAEIFTIDSLSAHADSQDTLNWLKGFKRPPQMIFINHGEIESAEALASKIKEELQFQVCIPSPGEVYELGRMMK